MPAERRVGIAVGLLTLIAVGSLCDAGPASASQSPAQATGTVVDVYD